SRRRHTRFSRDWSSDVCSSDLATGSSIEASVLITANLVDLKVPQIWAKAISSSHGKILARIGANHVIYPEREAGERVAHLVSGQIGRASCRERVQLSVHAVRSA